MDPQAKEYCSSCRCYRPFSEFPVNKHGKQLKTCSKHVKKRPLPEVDEWESFLYEINSWSKIGQSERLDLSYNLDLDQLPINFGHSIDVIDKSSIDFCPLNERIGILVYCIREAGGHKFRQTNNRKISRFTAYHYYSCCQDEAQFLESQSNGKRDRSQMKRFSCQSKLVLKTDLFNRRLNISLQHSYHMPYVDIRLSQEALEYVNSHSNGHTPAEIFRDLQSSKIPGADVIARHQIYYQWQRANLRIRRMDADQESGTKSYTMEYGLRDMEGDSEEPRKSEEENPKAIATKIKPTLDAAKDLVDEQTEIGNTKFLKKVDKANSKNVTLLDEIELRKN